VVKILVEFVKGFLKMDKNKCPFLIFQKYF